MSCPTCVSLYYYLYYYIREPDLDVCCDGHNFYFPFFFCRTCLGTFASCDYGWVPSASARVPSIIERIIWYVIGHPFPILPRDESGVRRESINPCMYFRWESCFFPLLLSFDY